MIQFVIADLPVLTIDTLQVAVGEEDVTDAVIPAYRGLFTVMEADGADPEACPAFAPAGGSFQPVNVTFARTNSTISQ